MKYFYTTLFIIALFFSFSSNSVGQVPVTGVSLNKTTESIDVYGSTTLVATVSPANAAYDSVIWSSSLPGNIVVLSNGSIYSNREGEAIITATTFDGGYTATCTITCTDESAANFNAFDIPGSIIKNIYYNDAVVDVLMPFGTDLSNLLVQYQVSPGATIAPDPAAVTDYSSPVRFTITSANGTIQSWTVSIAERPDLSQYHEYTLNFDATTCGLDWIDSTLTWGDGPFQVLLSSPHDDPPSAQANEGGIGLFPAKMMVSSTTGAQIIATEIHIFENCGKECTNTTFHGTTGDDVRYLPSMGEYHVFYHTSAGVGWISYTSFESEFKQIKIWTEGGTAPTNRRPIANAGTNKTVNEGAYVILDGTRSSDPDHDSFTYNWTTNSSEITLNQANSSFPNFTTPLVSQDTDFEIYLTVNDGTLTSLVDTVVVTVKVGNKRPVANAGTDQQVNDGDFVTLDGSASYDPEQDTITYYWTAPKDIRLSDNTAIKPTFTTAINTTANYTFYLTVSDSLLTSLVDTVQIFVTDINKKPIADAGDSISAQENTTVVLNGINSSDPDDDNLFYSWESPTGITLDDSTKIEPVFIAPEVITDSTLVFFLTVFDGELYSDRDTTEVFVENINRAPIANAGPDQYVNEADTVYLDGTASFDPEGDSLRFSWTTNDNIYIYESNLATTSFIIWSVEDELQDTISVFLTVNDGELTSVVDTVIIFATNINQKPISGGGYPAWVREGDQATLMTTFYDPDGDSLSYSWTSPPNIQLNDSTSDFPSFIAPEVQNDTTLLFTCIAFDGELYSNRDTTQVFVENINKAPIANAGPDQYVNEGDTVYLDGTASYDPDGDSLSFSWTTKDGIYIYENDLPTANFNIWYVNDEVQDTLTFFLIVNDGEYSSPVDTVIIFAANINQKPISGGVYPIWVREGDQTNLMTSFYDPDGDSLSYSWTSPPTIQLDDSTSAFPSFVAPEVENDTTLIFICIAFDGELYSDPDTTNVFVENFNEAPVAVFESTEMAFNGISCNEGEQVMLNGSNSSDPDNDSLFFSWIIPTDFLIDDSTSQTPNIVAPDVEKTESFDAWLKVSDGELSDSVFFIIQVKNVEDLIPDDLQLNNITLTASESDCFNAYNTITVAGNSATPVAVISTIVILERGSSTNFIAGQSITFLPGFHAQEGSYMDAHITTDGTFCDNQPKKTIIAAEAVVEKSKPVTPEEVNQDNITEPLLKVYPNPNNGRFIISLENFQNGARIMIYNSVGALIHQESSLDNKIAVELPDTKRGIYFVKAFDGSEQYNQKIIIQ